MILIFSMGTFGLFLFVFSYNLLYVSTFPYDTGGLLYPTALKQLFTGVYIKEICLIGLFSSIRDYSGNLTGLGQAVIMTVVTFSTVIYQFLLAKAFARGLEYLPASMQTSDKEEKKGKSKQQLMGALGYLHQILKACQNCIIVSQETAHDLQGSVFELIRNQITTFNHRAFNMNKTYDSRIPVVWIPKDKLGISGNEIANARDHVQDIEISDSLAELNMKGHLKLASQMPESLMNKI